MGYAAQDILSLAEKEKGYFEKRSLSDLDDKTVNADSGNFTKYTYDLDSTPDFYNGKKQGLMVDVFANKVIIKGIDFTEGNGGAFIPKATYVINTDKEG